MNEERRSVKVYGYEHLYDVSKSGRIIAKKTNHVKVFNGNAYNFKNVHLYRDGKRELFRTYDLWKETFGEDTPSSEFKGLK
ncbi:MAG TPA: 3-ketosteroid-delta-1-dehydrogenase [Metabacillus sp.]|nr:3-ketosteroid-delta-1-dehydrogenase [Metabacillus sp.]